jgi:hypothetical protein
MQIGHYKESGGVTKTAGIAEAGIREANSPHSLANS